MKAMPNSINRFKTAFTLVELLTVIAVIGILAALTLTVISHVTTTAKVNKAKIQMANIVLAIQAYDATYSHFPVSHAVQSAANPDFTFGGTLQMPSGPTTIGTLVGASVLKNDQVMAVLMNFTNYPNTLIPTINTNAQANSLRTVFLDASMSGDASLPGVGPDLVYRDPWGNPYIVSLDLNDDGVCEDSFYKPASISGGGLNGMILQPDGNYGFHGRIMVWSAGPDGKVSLVVTANQAENHDNILSWR